MSDWLDRLPLWRLALVIFVLTGPIMIVALVWTMLLSYPHEVPKAAILHAAGQAVQITAGLTIMQVLIQHYGRRHRRARTTSRRPRDLRQ